jgi:O-acetyl-ADP-ribose deacetylase (regulator of RNase III)
LPQPLLEFLLPDIQARDGIDAVAYEQDTELILRQDLEFADPGGSAADWARQAIVARAFTPGSVVVRETRPLQLFAIVHDLEREPTWQEAWIDTALAGILSVVEERRVRSLALPLLGTGHGRIGIARAAELLAARLAHPPQVLERVLLMLPRSPGPAVRSKLAGVTRSN